MLTIGYCDEHHLDRRLPESGRVYTTLIMLISVGYTNYEPQH
jgi:hypothetical protein